MIAAVFALAGNNGNGGGISPQPKSRSPSESAGGGLNWSAQFRERAASAVQRPQMGASPPAAGAGFAMGGFGAPSGGMPVQPHARARSEGGDVMAGGSPTAAARPQPVPHRRERKKPDEVGERMLRGEFYMD